MMTVVTRLLLLVQVLAATGLYYLADARLFPDQPAFSVSFAAGTVVAVRLLIVCNNFFIARIYGRPAPADRRLDARDAARLFSREFAASMYSSSWLMPFRSFDSRTDQAWRGFPVLLVHGYGCNSGYWRPMSNALARARINHHTLDLEPVFGDIDLYADLIAARIDAVCRQHRVPRLIVLAHSMGGLAMRAYLRKHGASKIAKVITLGTPHHGTALANFSGGTNCMQMGRSGPRLSGCSSSWLKVLGDGESDAVRALFVSIYSDHDNIIAPQDSARLPGAKNIELHGIGHVTLALDPDVQHIVIDEIQAVPSAAASATSVRGSSA